MAFRQLFPRPNWLVQDLTGPIRLFADWFLRAWNIIGQVEEWHEIGDTNEPAFENSWVNVGGAFETAAFYKDPFGRVHLKGAIDTGTNNTTAFTLPEGYRPAAELGFSGAYASYLETQHPHIKVKADGTVTTVSGSGAGVNLDVISFRAEQ